MKRICRANCLLDHSSALVIAYLFLLHTFVSAHAQIWRSNSAPSINWFMAASSADGSRLVAVAYAGPVYTSIDSGATWSATKSASNWNSVACSADGSTLIAGNGFAYVSTNSGATWKAGHGGDLVASTGDGQRLLSLWGTGGLQVSTNRGDTWTAAVALPSDQWTALGCSADGSHVVAASFFGALYVSTNFGQTWISNSIPGARWNSVSSSADGSKWVAAAGMANSAPGPIYFSTNSAASWTQANAPITNWVGTCASADGRTMFASTASDGQLNARNAIYRSTDYGVTWTRLNAPTPWWRGLACSADGGKLVVVAIGPIYTTQSVQPPNLNIASEGTNAEISWIVPSTNFFLQAKLSVDQADWTTVTDAPMLNFTNLQSFVTRSLSGPCAFYRLALQP